MLSGSLLTFFVAVAGNKCRRCMVDIFLYVPSSAISSILSNVVIDVQATVNPIPHNAINHSGSAFAGYEAMMFIFGFVWGCINIWACCAWVVQISNWEHPQGSFGKTVISSFYIFIGVPLFLLLAIMPFFGGWIVVPIVQKVCAFKSPLPCADSAFQQTWNHGCDSYPMVAILDAKSYNDPSYVVNVAHFYANTPSASNSNPLFTYEITNPDDGDIWLFSLREFDAAQSSIPLAQYPTLQAVHYNFVDDSLSGNCTLPTSTAANASTSVVPCMTGSFNQGGRLAFNFTSAVPLNSTLASAYPAGVANATTALMIPDKEWDVSGDAPALNLQQVDADGRLGAVVVKTTVTKPGDTTELKVCVGGVPDRENGLVSAEVLAPLGLVLMRQADYAYIQTSPSD